MTDLQKIAELRRTLNDFRKCGDTVKESFVALQKAFDPTKFFLPDAFDKFTKDFVAWSNESTKCHRLWQEIFDKPLTQNLAQVEIALTAYEKKIIAKSFFGRAEKFLSLTSADKKLEADLAAHRQKLTALLKKKSFDSKTKAAVEPYAKFVDVFNETDYGKKFSASKELSEFFSDDLIGRGIFDKMLTMSAQGKLTFEADTPPKKPVNPPPKNDSPDGFAKILHDKGALLTESDLAPWAEKFTVDPEPTRKINARKVKEDFKLVPPVERFLLIGASVFDSSFSIETLDPKKKSKTDNLENALELLRNKGYFKRYTLSGYGEIYGVSKNFFDFMKADKGKTFSQILPKNDTFDFPKLDDEIELLEDRVQIALPREIYIRLRVLANECKVSLNCHLFFTESLFACFKVGERFDLFVGCFWSTLDDTEKFLSNLTVCIDGCDKIDRVIVAGLNMSHAEKILDALEAAMAEKFPKTAEPYVYSVDEDAFCRRGTTEKLPLEKLWAKVTDSQPPDKPDDKKSDDKKSDDKKSDDKKSDDKKSDGKKSDDKKSDDKKSDGKKSDGKKSSGKTVDEATPDERAIVDEMLAAKKFYCATAYLNTLSLSDEKFMPLYRQLAAATNDPLFGMSYSAEKIISLIKDSGQLDETFLTAATLRTFFGNDERFDYGMKYLHGIVKNFALVESNAPLADLIFALMNFKDSVKNGADYYADYRVKNRQQSETKIARLREDAKNCIAHLRSTTDKTHHPRFIEAKKILFGDDSELASYLEFVAEDSFDAEISVNLKAYLAKNFIREDAALTVANLDIFKRDELINAAWNKVGGKNKLTGELKNYVNTLFKKAIALLCESVKIFEETVPLKADAGTDEYKKIRATLIAKAKAAQKILANKNVSANKVLIATLQEIIDKLEGTFTPDRQKYFYADFLRGTEILLNENYLPILTFNTLDGTNEGVTERIVAHARAALPEFEERIENIFKKNDWDFGTAQLIDAYLEEVDGDSFIKKRKYKLQASIDAVRRNALKAKKDFFGFIELAQSYGHFDNASLNAKEDTLKLIDRCFEFTDKLNNFGVFFRIKSYWEDKTRTDAAEYADILEKNLQPSIDNYCRKTNEAPDSSPVKRTVAQIQKMIERQNYTVAQGLINRLSDGNLFTVTHTTGQTHLQRFIKDYEDYFSRVIKSEPFQKLVDANKAFARAKSAKAAKGGMILAENWLPNGVPSSGDIGTDKLQRLLNALGFNVAQVERFGAIKKEALIYKIRLRQPSNGQSSNYKHPIPAFGSNAQANGFRVACLFGKYDAAGLIARFKELGDADDTLVLLDFALDLPERRSLARKIKAETGITKVFAVVDRVVMMYLVKNYDEPQINNMLMSLTMPFAACQPYVFNPNVPIPPEVFIGREKEMSRVLDFDGVNLVYGGRQLGKTALLKMACASLDRNENNDRAVFVDINKCDFAAAALKICKTLRDKNFFDETFSDTDDWSKLADAIKKRLASDVPNKIPRFLLALDETDDFIKSCRKTDFAPILQLVDIQKNPPDGSRFKFVMAGLRDVVRFYRNETLGNNGQFAKLPSLVVKPFDLDEAKKLLEEPLSCLGFYFPDNEKGDSLALMILETTNYFPGLIQLYCARLIEALSRKDYAGYTHAGNLAAPIYRISDKHVQNVLSEESFNEEIKTKIHMTLRLGDDKYYYVIAILMAWIYHNDDLRDGYSAEDILLTAEKCGVKKFLPDNVNRVEALLKELCELNILREIDKGRYLFVRQRFLNIIGTLDEIELELANNFGEHTA